MKIVYCTDQVYLHGGIEKVMAQKINYLIKQGYEVHLITSEQKNKPFCYSMNEKLFHHDLGINYNRNKSYLTSTNLKKVPKHFFKLKNKLKEIKPDAVVICNYTFDFYFVPFINKYGKTIREYHASRFYSSRQSSSIYNKIKKSINTFFEKKYSSIVLLNKDEKKYYKTNNLQVIPNSIQLNEELQIDYNQREKIIIAAGRIAPVKQFDHLILAWSKIHYKFTDWEVHIYGDGDKALKEKYQKLIANNNIQNIVFKGVTNKLAEKMKTASLFALTSSTECFPMVLLESLSCGLPVVSYKAPHGAENIITDGSDGILVSLNNIEEFSNSLESIIKNKDKRKQFSKDACKNIKRYEEELVMKEWLKLFTTPQV